MGINTPIQVCLTRTDINIYSLSMITSDEYCVDVALSPSPHTSVHVQRPCSTYINYICCIWCNLLSVMWMWHFTKAYFKNIKAVNANVQLIVWFPQFVNYRAAAFCILCNKCQSCQFYIITEHADIAQLTYTRIHRCPPYPNYITHSMSWCCSNIRETCLCCVIAITAPESDPLHIQAATLLKGTLCMVRVSPQI